MLEQTKMDYQDVLKSDFETRKQVALEKLVSNLEQKGFTAIFPDSLEYNRIMEHVASKFSPDRKNYHLIIKHPGKWVLKGSDKYIGAHEFIPEDRFLSRKVPKIVYGTFQAYDVKSDVSIAQITDGKTLVNFVRFYEMQKR